VRVSSAPAAAISRAFRRSHTVMGRPPRLAGGLVDPAANNCNLADGQALIQWYRKKGLQLQAIENPLETGIVEVGDRMLSGRLKVFESLSRYREERRIYRHDEKGQVVKDRDNLQDATRCLVVGVQSMRTETVKRRRLYFSPAPPCRDCFGREW